MARGERQHVVAEEPTLVEDTLRLVHSLLELSRDLERNQEDSTFSQNGGEIIYVLDENIFEMFVKPMQFQHLVRTFHLPQVPESRGKRAAQSQSALIAAEYILSGRLPGKRRPKLYVSQWHRRELLDRIEVLTDRLSAMVRENPDRAAQELESKLRSLTSSNFVPPRSGTVRGADDPQLFLDIQELWDAGMPPDGLRRYELARAAVKILASSELSEPLDQLHRLATAPLSVRLRTFHLDFRPEAADSVDLHSEASRWFELFIRERDRTRKGTRRRVRTAASLWFDAQSLALVRWVARRRLNRNQRIVMVTGDKIIFDAYRRWFVERPRDQEAFEPFLLRRAVQYAPVFNLSDAPNDISKTTLRENIAALFESIHAAIEIALLPFNLSRMSAKGESREHYAVARGREYFAQKLHDHFASIGAPINADPAMTYLTSRLDARWYTSQRDRIREIQGLWEKAERIASGAYFDQIAARLSDEQRSLAAEVERLGEKGAGEALKAYLAATLNDLVSHSLQMWLPIALEQIGEVPAIPPTLRRPPLTLWYETPSGQTLADIVEQWLRGNQKSVALTEVGYTKDPEPVFALASTFALFTSDWSNAERFADLALRARTIVSGANRHDAPALELKLLLSVARRFRIGEIDSHIGLSKGEKSRQIAKRDVEMVRRRYHETKQILDDCAAQHGSLRGDQTVDQGERRYHTLGLMRTLSERAALTLFVAAELIPARDLVGDDRLEAEALGLVDIAKKDLKQCFDLERAINDDSAVVRISRQYVPNVAAAEMLRWLLLSNKADYRFDEHVRAHIQRIEQLAIDVAPKAHPLLKVELSAFLTLANSRRSDWRKELNQAVREQSKLTLPLDRFLVQAIASAMSRSLAHTP